MYLRAVELTDVDAYVRMRCDPVMTHHLGGPRLADDMPAKVVRDVADVAAGRAWIEMIVIDETTVAGTITLWRDDADVTSEIGWMVLPEFQGQGLAKRALATMLDRARMEGRWGVVHAYPSVDNAPSNAICRSSGFTLAGAVDIVFAGLPFRSNDWWVDTSSTASSRSR